MTELNRSSAAFDRKENVRSGSAAESAEAIGEDDTLSAIEQMLANHDDRLCGRDGPQAGALSRADRCATMRGMLDPLVTLTPAGQRHQMDRLIDALAAETDGDGSRVGGANRLSLREQIDCLRKDAQRASPDVDSFCHRAKGVIAMLESVA